MIAFQGEPGAYSEQAIFDYFGKVETHPCESFDAVFEAVVSNTCEAALIPIENSLAGSIHQNYDLLLRYNLHIVGEYFLRVRHCLIAFSGVEKKDIRARHQPSASAGSVHGVFTRLGRKSGAGLRYSWERQDFES